MPRDATAWDGRSHGGPHLLRFGALLLRRLGPRAVHLVSLAGAVVAVLLLDRARAAGYDYWRRQRPGIDRTGALALTWRQLASFGRIVCDRALAFHRRDALCIDDRAAADRLAAALRAGRGCIVLAAHVGNWELAGRLLARLDPPPRVTLVKVGNEDPRERALVDAAMGGHPSAVIDPRDGVAAAVAVRAALADNQVVGFLGDRVFPGQGGARVRFLAATARFPLGPFQSAQQTGAPLLACLLMRRGHLRYRLHVAGPLRVPRPPGRRARRAAVVAVCRIWAAWLERVVRRYPFQWHNFYRFWG